MKSIFTSPSVISRHIEALTKTMAHNVHNAWMEQRKLDGWSYGEKRDDDNKKHPNLRPYDELPAEERIYNELTATTSIQFALDEDFRIVRQKSSTPRTIPDELVQLEEKIAKRIHDAWMEQRITDGWTYGAKRDDDKKLHPNIVDYEDLSESDKELDRLTASEVYYHILQAGYSILPPKIEGTTFWQKLKYARHNPAHFRDYLITDGGFRHLTIFSLPALSCLLLAVLAFAIFFHGENMSLIQETIPDSKEPVRDNHVVENMRAIIFHMLDPGYLYYNMTQSFQVQLFAFVVTALGMIFVNGLLISTIVSFIARRRDHAEKGLVTYPKLENHVILIGYSEMSVPIINKVLNSSQNGKKHPQQVVILTSKEMGDFRAYIHSQIENKEEYRVIFYSGSYESKDNLNRLCLAQASSIFVLGEDNTLGRDSKNIETLHRIAKIFQRSATKIRSNIYLQYDRISSASIAHHLDFQKNIFKSHNSAKDEVEFYTYNFYENWARILWGGYHVWSNLTANTNLDYASLDRDELRDDNHVHLIIIGFNRMGRALLLEALRVCHYRNGQPTRITIIDARMNEKQRFFEAQYPRLKEQIKDIHITYREAWAESDETRQYISDCAKDEQQILTIAICVKDADIALAIGLNLPEPVYFQYEHLKAVHVKPNDQKYQLIENNSRTQILIRQEIQGGMSQQLDVEKSRYKNVQCFGMLNGAYNPLMIDDTLGMIINANYNMDHRRPLLEQAESLSARLSSGLSDEKRQWRELTEINRWSNRYQVDIFDYYYRCFEAAGIDSLKKLSAKRDEIYEIMEENDIGTRREKLKGNLIYELAQVEHRRWLAERSIIGWRQRDEGKNEQRIDSLLLHNCIIDFDQLSSEYKFKDIDPVINSFVLTQVYTDYLRGTLQN